MVLGVYPKGTQKVPKDIVPFGKGLARAMFLTNDKVLLTVLSQAKRL